MLRIPPYRKADAVTYFRSLRRREGMRRAYWKTVLAFGWTGYTMPALVALTGAR